MDTLPIKPERKAQLEAYVQRRGQDSATALDDALANYLEWDQQDFDHAVDGLRKSYLDVKAGRTFSGGDRCYWPRSIEFLTADISGG